MREPKGEEKEKEKRFEEIMWEIFPNLIENFNLYSQEAQQTPCRINIKNLHQDIAESNH